LLGGYLIRRVAALTEHLMDVAKDLLELFSIQKAVAVEVVDLEGTLEFLGG